MFENKLENIQQNNIKELARTISLVENDAHGYIDFLKSLPYSNTPVVGITGAPGAGKSTLTDALIAQYTAQNKKVAVLCVDPSSPFNLGAVLGDRIRMSRWYTNDNVYIRSLASRGAMGGLHPKIIEITDVVKAAHFDVVIIETVGVGQSEVEIAGLADVTVVVLVPEGGDEIQTMKAGLMEIADVFAVNKSDRPGADTFMRNLRMMLAPAFSKTDREIQMVATVASKNQGVDQLYEAINTQLTNTSQNERKHWLLTEKAYQILQHERMKDIKKIDIKNQLYSAIEKSDFNLYRFIEKIQ